MTLDQIETIGTVLGVLLALAAMVRLLIATVRWLRPRIRTVFKSLVEFDTLESKFDELTETTRKLEKGVELLIAEMKPNGGSSLRDQINRIEGRQLYLDGRSKAMLNEDENGVFETTKDGNCTWVNRRMIRMTGRSFEELKGHGWMNTVHPDDRESVEEQWDSAKKENRSFMITYRLLHTDADPILVRTTGHRIESAGGGLSGYTVIVTCMCNKGLQRGNQGLWCGWRGLDGEEGNGRKPCD